MPGTGEPLLRLSPEEREKVKATLRRGDHLPPRVRERLEMVKAADLGRDLDEIARPGALARRARCAAGWLGAFASGGIGAVADAPRPGRPALADAAYLGALEEALETPPRELGLVGFDVWTSERLSAYLAQRRGARIAPGWLRVLLGRMRFACGRPKHTLEHLRDPEEVAAFDRGGARAEAEKK